MDGAWSLDFFFSYNQQFLVFSLKEVDWSLRLAEGIANTPWECTNCGNTFSISGVDKLQHKKGEKMWMLMMVHGSNLTWLRC
jgi:hypothetical protein